MGLGLIVAAWARPHPIDMPISIEQEQNRTLAAFADVDSNGDGVLSKDEFQAAKLPNRRRRSGAFLHHPERHQDPSELGAAEHGDRLFGTLDEDADGYLSREEVNRERLHEARISRIKQRVFARLDRDDSGEISEDEFSARIDYLNRLDKNADGEISRDELRYRIRARREAG